MAGKKPFVVKLEDRKLQQDLRRAVNNCVSMRPAWKAVGELVVSSILMNFRDEGRPIKWAQFSSKYQRRSPDGKTKRGGMASAKLLVHSGTMRNSVTHRVRNAYSVEVGTNVEYAATHHFGDKGRKVFGGPMTADIPARPFVMVQSEDIPKIGKTLTDFIARQMK